MTPAHTVFSFSALKSESCDSPSESRSSRVNDAGTKIDHANASGQMELLLVAAKKDFVADYAAVAREAALVPTVVDVAAFTVQNAFEA